MAERWVEQERRADYRAGVVASILANVNRDDKKRPEPFQPGDFFPSLRQPARERQAQTPEQMKNALIAFTRRTGGKVKELDH